MSSAFFFTWVFLGCLAFFGLFFLRPGRLDGNNTRQLGSLGDALKTDDLNAAAYSFMKSRGRVDTILQSGNLCFNIYAWVSEVRSSKEQESYVGDAAFDTCSNSGPHPSLDLGHPLLEQWRCSRSRRFRSGVLNDPDHHRHNIVKF